MTRLIVWAALACSALSVPVVASAETSAATGAQHYTVAAAQWQGAASPADQRLAIFTPTANPDRTTIDYEIWDYALKRILLNMGPASGKGAPRPDAQLGTRIKYGPQSRYRLEGSLALFRFFDDKVKASFTEYRQDLEGVAATVDIASLPRNEQLAFWINLHNVALMEQIAKEWPVREPRDIRIGGVPLDEARFITLRGIPVSLRDIREQIVFRHWRDPKVIYGFWRGEIGGPQLQSYAFTGDNVGSLLDVAATDFVNSLRGTQKWGGELQVSTLYAEAAPFYFPAFETDLRAHLAKYAEPRVAQLLADTSGAKPTIFEHEIADLHGGSRPPNTLFVSSQPGASEGPLAVVGCSDQLGQASCDLILDRKQKLETMQRRNELNPRVFFSNISLPGDPPNKNAVE
jgi:hypothetical protein